MRVPIASKRVGSAHLSVNELLELRSKSAAENDVLGRAVALFAPTSHEHAINVPNIAFKSDQNIQIQ